MQFYFWKDNNGEQGIFNRTGNIVAVYKLELLRAKNQSNFIEKSWQNYWREYHYVSILKRILIHILFKFQKGYAAYPIPLPYAITLICEIGTVIERSSEKNPKTTLVTL